MPSNQTNIGVRGGHTELRREGATPGLTCGCVLSLVFVWSPGRPDSGRGKSSCVAGVRFTPLLPSRRENASQSLVAMVDLGTGRCPYFQLDCRGILRIESEARAGYGAVRVRFEVDSDVSPELIEDFVKGSPMFDVFINPVSVEVSCETPTTVAAGRSHDAED